MDIYEDFIINNENICKEILIIYLINLFYNCILSDLKTDKHIKNTDIFIHIYKDKNTLNLIDINNIDFNQFKTNENKTKYYINKPKNNIYINQKIIGIIDCIHYIKINLNNRCIKLFLEIIDNFISEFEIEDNKKM